jgi:protein gp37
MMTRPDLIWMILTKRPGLAYDFFKKHFPSVFRIPMLQNLWLGVTVENADNLWRIEELLKLRPYAAKLFVSVEPMLGPVRMLDILMGGRNPGFCLNCNDTHGFTRCPNYGGVSKELTYGTKRKCDDFKRRDFNLDWVIVGSETGPGKRPMELAWARDLRDQCQAASVPFFFKKGSDGSRLLDGREWNEVPE